MHSIKLRETERRDSTGTAPMPSGSETFRKGMGRASAKALSVADTQNLPPVPSLEGLEDLLDIEDGEEIVAGIVDEIVDQAAGILYQRYLQNLLTPFVANQTRMDIVRLVSILEVPKDSGVDVAEKIGFSADPEPPCVLPDVLSRGIVPVKKRPPKIANIVPSLAESGAIKTPKFRRKMYRGARGDKSSARDSRDTLGTPERRHSSSTASPVVQQAVMDVRKVDDEGQRVREKVEHEKKAAEQLRAKMIAAEKEEAERYERLKMELKGKEYTYDKDKVIIINPIVPEKLPNHRVKLKVNVKGDGSGEAGSGTKKGAPRMHRPNATTKKKSRPKSDTPETFIKEVAASQAPMVDVINVAPGVMLREGARVRSGPSRGTDPHHMSRKEYEARQAGLLLGQDIPGGGADNHPTFDLPAGGGPPAEHRKDRISSIRMAAPGVRRVSQDPLGLSDRGVTTSAIVSPVPPERSDVKSVVATKG